MGYKRRLFVYKQVSANIAADVVMQTLTCVYNIDAHVSKTLTCLYNVFRANARSLWTPPAPERAEWREIDRTHSETTAVDLFSANLLTEEGDYLITEDNDYIHY